MAFSSGSQVLRFSFLAALLLPACYDSYTIGELPDGSTPLDAGVDAVIDVSIPDDAPVDSAPVDAAPDAAPDANFDTGPEDSGPDVIDAGPLECVRWQASEPLVVSAPEDSRQHFVTDLLATAEGMLVTYRGPTAEPRGFSALVRDGRVESRSLLGEAGSGFWFSELFARDDGQTSILGVSSALRGACVAADLLPDGAIEPGTIREIPQTGGCESPEDFGRGFAILASERTAQVNSFSWEGEPIWESLLDEIAVPGDTERVLHRLDSGNYIMLIMWPSGMFGIYLDSIGGSIGGFARRVENARQLQTFRTSAGSFAGWAELDVANPERRLIRIAQISGDPEAGLISRSTGVFTDERRGWTVVEHDGRVALITTELLTPAPEVSVGMNLSWLSAEGVTESDSPDLLMQGEQLIVAASETLDGEGHIGFSSGSPQQAQLTRIECAEFR